MHGLYLINTVLVKLILALFLILTGQNLYTLKFPLTGLFLLPGPQGTSLIPLLRYRPSESRILGNGYPERMSYSRECFLISGKCILVYRTAVRSRGVEDSFPSEEWSAKILCFLFYTGRKTIKIVA